jgi:MYXO-CTERM domain-containing protein
MIRIVRCLGVALVVLSSAVAGAQVARPHMPRATYIVAAPQPNAPKPTDVLTGQVIYLNNCSAGCNVKPGTEDAATMTSEIAGKAASWTEFAWQPGEWDAVVKCVKEVYSPYNVVVTDQPPQSAYNMEIIAGDPRDINLDSSIGGIALVSGDCSARQDSIAFAFTSSIDVFAQEDANNRVWGMCWTASQEIAHIYGLDHEYAYLDDNSSACNDPMTYRADCGGQKFFRNRAANCGEFGPARPGCGPGNTCASAQNSHLKLLGLFGPGTPLTTPPVVAVTPPAGGTIANGATLVINASAQRGIAKIDLYINGYQWATAKGHAFGPNGQTDSAYTITLPGDVPDGVMDIVAKAYDDIGVETDSATVTVTKGAPCADASTCAKGQNCSAGKCFWDPATGMLGDSCTYPQACVSGLCEGTSDTDEICTQGCVVGSTDACPKGYDCLMTSGNDGVCFTQSTGGCCNVGSDSHAVYAHAFLALAVLGFAARRRRR